MDDEKFRQVVLQQLQTLTQGQVRLDLRFGEVESRLGNVEKGQGRLEARLDSVEKGQTRLGVRLDGVESCLGVVEKGQSELGLRLDGVDSRLGAIEKGQLRLEARIEGQVMDKISALFDDREVQNDRFERMESKIDAVFADTRYLVTRIARLGEVTR